jgi:biotin transport system substrate-specific component
MSKESLAMPVSASPAAPAVARPVTWLRSSGIVLGGSLLLAICSHIAVPLLFTPVPLTLQTFAVLLLGLLLSPRLAAATVIAYLVEGAAGLPVFAPSPLTGIAHLIGPTGGYLLSYPFAAALTSFLWRRVGHGIIHAAFSAAAGSIVILASGAAWLLALTHAGTPTILSTAVVPFVPGDLLKIAAAALVAAGMQRFHRSNN